MESKNVRAEVINDLIRINQDRIEGYQLAIKELHELDIELKAVFENFIRDSENNKSELTKIVAGQDDEAAEGSTMPGKIYRAWMEVKTTFTGKDRKAVLELCEFGEDAAQKAYKEAIEILDATDTEAYQLIVEQKAHLKKAHDKIKEYRDAAELSTK